MVKAFFAELTIELAATEREALKRILLRESFNQTVDVDVRGPSLVRWRDAGAAQCAGRLSIPGQESQPRTPQRPPSGHLIKLGTTSSQDPI